MSDSVDDGVTMANLVQAVPQRFVLVTGAGRSGTSTVAGSLNYLGLHVPRPVLGSNRSNPRGFFEPTWAIDFHKRILERAGVDMWDGRPDGWAKVQEVLRPADRHEIEMWLSEGASQAPQVVVKDPRSAWVPGLWADAAHNIGFTTGYLTMLRHPAEVVGSRTTYYAKGDAAAVRSYQVTNIARWVNTNLMTERQTRGHARVFLPYFDLIDDWRAAMSEVRDALDLTFNADIETVDHHQVDDFIDPDLRRHTVQWADLDVPHELQEIAEETWLACVAIADGHGWDVKAQDRLDDLGERYASLFRDATAIANDATSAAANIARKKAVRQTRTKMKKVLGQAPPAAPPRPALASSWRRVAGRAVATARRKIRSR